MLVAVCLIAKRVARRFVEAVEGQNAKALVAERSLDLTAAVERSDRRGVEDEIGSVHVRAGRRARSGVGIDESRALCEEGPVLEKLPLELLRCDRLLIDLDIGKVRIERADETDRGSDRVAEVPAERAHVLGQKLAVGLLKEIAVLANAGQTVDVGTRLGSSRGRCRNIEVPGGPKARIVLESRPGSAGSIAHDRVPDPRKVLARRRDLSYELQPPRLLAAARHAQDIERNNHHGAPRPVRGPSGGAPSRAKAHVFIGLLVARAARRRFKII